MEKEPNLHTLSEERKELKRTIKQADLPESISAVVEKDLEEIEAQIDTFNIKEEGGLRKAIERVKADRVSAENNLHIDRDAIAEQLGPEYVEIQNLYDKHDDLRDFEMQRMLELKKNPHAKRVLESIIKTARQERHNLEKQLDTKKAEDSQTYRAFELVEDKLGMKKEGHIAPTESVRNNLSEIGKKMMTGKPMFLHGPTGTGKTSLARFSAKHFTGNDAEMVYCNPQTRESSIWGKTGIRPTKDGAIETIDIFGPLAKAMRDGRPVIFDEFTALPKEQMVFIKGVFNAKPGDEVNIVGNGRIPIKPGFQMIFTANLKSEKNPERQELPPEIAREFEQNNLKINYTPKDEAYDIMLARLMNPDGSIDMSWQDLNVTLPKLCEAMDEVQIAYTGLTREETARLTGTMEAGGKTQGLKKMVFTQGTVEAIFEQWGIEKTNGHFTFVEFIDKRLAVALTFEEYPLPDRVLVAKILASKGLLRTLTPADINLPADVFNFDAAKKLRGNAEANKELIEESGDVKHISLKEVADLDPFGKRVKAVSGKAAQFLTPDAKKKNKLPETAGEGLSTIEQAQEIMKENFLGPEAIQKTFGFTPENIPAIPFSPEELEKAKELNQILILQVEKDENGNEFGMKAVVDKLQDKTSDNNDLMRSIDWYKNEKFFTEPGTIRGGWKLVSKENIADTSSKNYLEQTEALIFHYVSSVVGVGVNMPQEYSEAIDEFNAERTAIAAIIDSDWKLAGEKLANLKITELLRETAAETFYRLAIQQKVNSDRLLPSTVSWSFSRGSDGHFVYVGLFDSGGVSVNGNTARLRNAALGSVFSRMK